MDPLSVCHSSFQQLPKMFSSEFQASGHFFPWCPACLVSPSLSIHHSTSLHNNLAPLHCFLSFSPIKGILHSNGILQKYAILPHLTMWGEREYCDLITKGKDGHNFILAAVHLSTYRGTPCSLEASFKNRCLTRTFLKLLCLQELQACAYKSRPPWWEHSKAVYSEFVIGRESAIIIYVWQRLKVS